MGEKWIEKKRNIKRKKKKNYLCTDAENDCVIPGQLEKRLRDIERGKVT